MGWEWLSNLKASFGIKALAVTQRSLNKVVLFEIADDKYQIESKLLTYHGSDATWFVTIKRCKYIVFYRPIDLT